MDISKISKSMDTRWFDGLMVNCSARRCSYKYARRPVSLRDAADRLADDRERDAALRAHHATLRSSQDDLRV
ncbi:unnamed protein product [Arctia plantaginis]|uniref:Uncharacterized protein n=1 Tax=Arctia plantaginis TaxID=874455 RepID=A0A8S1B615_ARCPL|nr:unnamed protein product [Arctia plantaginis]